MEGVAGFLLVAGLVVVVADVDEGVDGVLAGAGFEVVLFVVGEGFGGVAEEEEEAAEFGEGLHALFVDSLVIGLGSGLREEDLVEIGGESVLVVIGCGLRIGYELGYV